MSAEALGLNGEYILLQSYLNELHAVLLNHSPESGFTDRQYQLLADLNTAKGKNKSPQNLKLTAGQLIDQIELSLTTIRAKDHIPQYEKIQNTIGQIKTTFNLGPTPVSIDQTPLSQVSKEELREQLKFLVILIAIALISFAAFRASGDFAEPNDGLLACYTISGDAEVDEMWIDGINQAFAIINEVAPDPNIQWQTEEISATEQPNNCDQFIVILKELKEIQAICHYAFALACASELNNHSYIGGNVEQYKSMGQLDPRNPRSPRNLVTTTLHELGHQAGMGHDQSSPLMNPGDQYIDKSEIRRIFWGKNSLTIPGYLHIALTKIRNIFGGKLSPYFNRFKNSVTS